MTFATGPTRVVNFRDIGSGKTINLTMGPTGSGFTIGSVNGNPRNIATGPNPQFADDISIVKSYHQIWIRRPIYISTDELLVRVKLDRHLAPIPVWMGRVSLWRIS
jgi:hypothetical protein